MLICPDHAEIPVDELTKFVKKAVSIGADSILTTQKDWVKIGQFLPSIHAAKGCRILVPLLGICFRSGESELRQILIAQD